MAFAISNHEQAFVYVMHALCYYKPYVILPDKLIDSCFSSQVIEINGFSDNIWKYLIQLDTVLVTGKRVTDHIKKLYRSILLKLVARKLSDEYIQSKIVRMYKPSKLALFAPRRNTTHRTTGLYKAITFALAHEMNVLDVPEFGVIDFTSDVKGYTLLTYRQYNKILSILTHPPMPVTTPLLITDNDKTASGAQPLSDLITHPRPEPVEIVPTELFAPLYEYLKQSQQHQRDVVNKSFERGTVCADGRLDLCKQVIGPGGISDLLSALRADSTSDDPKVRHLLLGNNICGDELGHAIADFISSGTSALTSWYIAGNNLTHEGLAPICQALANDKQVRQLWLKRNPLHLMGCQHIVSMLQTNQYLEVLDLTNTGIMDEGATLIINNIGNIQHLYLSSNGLTHVTCQALLSLLSIVSLKSLKSLGLGCNRLGNKGAQLIAEFLSSDKCGSLQLLEIASCGIEQEGADYISQSLRTNKSLVYLDMGYLRSTTDLGEISNNIGSTGAIHLAEALTENVTLRGLDLVRTGIKQSGVSAFVNILCNDQNKCLIYLNIEQFGIPHNELSRETIRKALIRNKNLLTTEQQQIIDNVINPPHLQEIKSVYRINED